MVDSYFLVHLVLVIVTVLLSCASSTGSTNLNITISSNFSESAHFLTNSLSWFFIGSRFQVLRVYNIRPTMVLEGFHPNDDFAMHLIREISVQSHVPVVYQTVLGNETQLSWTVENRKTGVLLIGDSFETIKGLFGSLKRDVNNNGNGDFLFVIVAGQQTTTGLKDERPERADAQVMGSFFRGLWLDFNILNALLVVCRCDDGERVIRDLDFGFYDPFQYVGGFDPDSVHSWGQFHWSTGSALQDGQRKFITKRYVNDFRGYPIKLNQFVRYPTAIDRKYIPIVVQNSYVYSQCTGNGKSGPIIISYLLSLGKYYAKLAPFTDLFGHDGLILRNLELLLNFSKRNVPVPLEYGWMTENGTFVGSIGDILSKAIDISFNGRFIKYYDTFDVGFMTPVLFENFCLVAPKALRRPEYLRIFQCFHPTVWVAFILINLTLGCFWFLLKRIQFRCVGGAVERMNGDRVHD